jgi:hypothetical protein
VLGIILLALLVIGMAIGLQRGTTANVLTTAAGATAQTGSVFAIPQDWSPSDELAYQVHISGGTFSALSVNFFFSLDGVNFAAAPQYQDNTHLDNTNVVEVGATAVLAKFVFMQVSISGGVVASGSPVVTVTIWPR